MKKILKSALMFAAASLAFAGCSKDASEDIAPDFGGAKLKITANASLAETRVDVGEYNGTEFPLTWGEGDALAVVDLDENYGGSGNSAGIAIPQFDLTAGAGEKTATFDGEVSESADSFYAVYPYSAMFQSNPKYPDFNITFPNVQTPTAASLVDPEAVILVSDATSIVDGALKFQFKHIAAYAQMTLKGLTGNIKSVEFSASKDITGSYYYYYDGSESKSAGSSSYSFKSITVNADNLTVNGGTCKVLFSLFPVELSKFTVTVNYANGDSKTRTCTTDSALSFKAGIVKGFTVDMSEDDVEEPAKDWSGNYLILTQLSDESYWALSSTAASNNRLTAVSYDYSNEANVNLTDATLYWSLEKQSDGTYTLMNGDNYIAWKPGSATATSASNTAILTSDPFYVKVEEVDDGNVEIISTIEEDFTNSNGTPVHNIKKLARNATVANEYWAFYTSGASSLMLVPATFSGSTEPEQPETPGEVKVATVAEFNAAEESKTQVYQLTGVVSGSINTTFGNFDLVDETGSVYVYGLTATELGYGATNDKSYGSLGIEAGDKITIKGYRGSYGDKIEVMYAWFVEIVEKGPGSTEPETPNTTHAGTLNDPFTVADAIIVAKATGTTPTTDWYYIKGTIASIKYQFSAAYGTANFDMVDEGSSDKFTAYSVKYFNNEPWVEGDETVDVGDVVIVYGQILNYNNNTPETQTGACYLYDIVQKGAGDDGDDEDETGNSVVFTFSEMGYSNAQEVSSVYVNPVTISFDKGTNSNAPKYYDSGTAIRLYGGGTMTISGATITKIKIEYSSSDKNTNTISATPGSFENNTWTGRSSYATFTVGGTSGHCKISSVKVYYE